MIKYIYHCTFDSDRFDFRGEHRMKRGFQPVSRLAVLLLVFLALLNISPWLNASAGKARTVRVAYPIQEGLTEVDEKGRYSGYTYEYLQEIAQYTGWNYEFVQVPGTIDQRLTELLKMTRTGEVDLMGEILYTKDTASQFDFSGHSYGIAETVLQTLYDVSNDIVVDSQTMQTMRIAVYRNSKLRTQEMMDYCEMNLITPELIYCENEEEQVQALKDGRADALLNTSMSYIEGLRTIARFAPRPFYFVTAKGDNKGLIKELNAAMTNIDQTDPNFSARLFEKYFVAPNNKLSFSDAETAFIQKASVIRAGVLRSQPPYQSYDTKTQKPRGISVSLLDNIASRTGLRIEYVVVPDEARLYQMVAAGELDLVAAMTYDYHQAQENGVSMSRPYAAAQSVVLINSGIGDNSLEGRRLALLDNISLSGDGPENVIRFQTFPDCIKAVNSGAADYLYVDGYTAQYYLNQSEYHNLRSIPQPSEVRKICFGVSNPGNRELLNILNKAVLTLSEPEIQSLVYQNTAIQQNVTLSGIMRQYPIETVTLISLFLLFIIGALSFGLYQRSKSNQKTALELQKHLQMYELMNDYFFEYDYKTKLLMVSNPSQKEKGGAELTSFDCSLPPQTNTEGKSRPRFLDVVLSGRDEIREIQLDCLDGQKHWLRLAVKTVCSETGKPAYAIGKINVIDHEKQEQAKLLEQAQKDSLTNVLNAKVVRNSIEAALSSLWPGTTGALLLIDIDYFKSVNDTYGHMRGDQVLKEVAGILKNSFQNGIVGRPGGDEFIVYLKDMQSRDRLCKQCEAVLAKLHTISLTAEKNVTISAGVALAVPGISYHTLYQMADKALYSAKRNGRDRFEFASGTDKE